MAHATIFDGSREWWATSTGTGNCGTIIHGESSCNMLVDFQAVSLPASNMLMPPESMSGKICIVTGANSGIGKETALGLGQMGAHVVMVCRNAEKGKVALEEIRRESGSSQVDLLIANMSSQASVRALAEQIQRKYPRLDVLVNNAGGAARARTLSADRIEMTLATNHLGAALLTLLLLDLLKASAPARIVNVSSSEAQHPARLDTNDLQFERKYGAIAAYRQSKLLMNAFTFELARRLARTICCPRSSAS
jgi:NAD(P)-dependent dehydrogenase (short-subunit alcohol dehydrogenase family)